MVVRLENILGSILILVLVLVAFGIYAPGRYGDFLLDDYANISSLGQVEQGLDGLVRYLFSDIYGGSNRWLSKLSFLVDTTVWPAEAFRFKQNNILLHILNGLLIIWAFLRLMRMLGHSERSSQITALVLGAIWLLHPLNVSTALYIVQRMTELSALFILAGMLFYLKGRQLLPQNSVKAYTWMSGGLIVCTTLGYLSKENGALLPLYILALESILLRQVEAPRHFKYWKSMFLYFPAVALLAWLAYKLPVFMKMDAYRSFDMWERLMTEARVLTDYLRLILIPTRSGTGVFHDDFQISRGLLDPPPTLISIVLIAWMFVAAWVFRKKLPILCFGIAWFFVGHILESSVVPLELYFEHRNYIPMLGPLFVVCYYTVTSKTRLKPMLYIAIGLFVSFSAMSTWQNVRVWTNVSENLEAWENEHPDSPRMLQYASNLYTRMDQYDEAQKRLTRFVALKPEWAGPKLKLVLLSCASGKNRMDRSMDDLITGLAIAEYESVSHNIIDNLFKGMQKKPCDVLTMENIGQMLEQLIANPNFRKQFQEMADLYAIRARYNGYLGNIRQQAIDFQESYRWKNNHYVARAESEVWASLGEYDKALEAIKKAKADYYIYLQGFKYYFDSDELDQWEGILTRLKYNNTQVD